MIQITNSYMWKTVRLNDQWLGLEIEFNSNAAQAHVSYKSTYLLKTKTFHQNDHLWKFAPGKWGEKNEMHSS